MRRLDLALQRWRIARAARHIPDSSAVLDVGCSDGALFRQLGDRMTSGLGVDPLLPGDDTVGRFPLRKGTFPEAVGTDGPFDAIVMLAVVEHIPPDLQEKWASACEELLRPGGRLVISVPSPSVDRILDVLKALRLVDGMALEEHYGFRPSLTPRVFGRRDLRLVTSERFQLGLNHLYVFERCAS